MLVAPIDVIALAALLAPFGSLGDAIDAVFATLPTAVGSTCTTRLNAAVAPAANDAIVQVTVPLAPGAGVAHVNAGPLVWVSDANVVPDGSGSVSATVTASDGPLSCAVSAYAMSVPADATPGPDFVSARSALTVVVAVLVDELFAAFGSDVVVATVAVFEIALPLAVDDALRTTSVNTALDPAASVAMLHVTVAPVVQANVGPLVWLSETNVVPAGSTSDRLTDAASDGPAFDTVSM